MNAPRVAPVAGDSEGGEADAPVPLSAVITPDAPSADADGWIPFKATADSVCPVSPNSFVEARLATGAYERPAHADELMWRYCGDISIVAYRVLGGALRDDMGTPAEVE